MDENEQLERLGIKNRVIDFLNSRKTFEVVSEYVKNLYIQKILSFSEKAYLEDYIYGRKNRAEMFGKRVPIFTHYQTELYRDIARCDKERGGHWSEECQILSKKFAALPQYISVGNNPSLEGKEIC